MQLNGNSDLFSRIKNDDLLKCAVQQGIINLDDVREKMKQEERKRLLEKHCYKIYEQADGRMRTYLPDDTKKSKRRPLVKKTKEDLEKDLINFYAALEDEQKEKEIVKTIRLVYPEWLKYKFNHTQSTSTIRRIQNDWNKYYEDNPIVDVPLQDLTFVMLDNWACGVINTNKLNKKQYYNLSIIIRQTLDYCTLDGVDLLQYNPFEKVKIRSKLFYEKPKPKSETQVFLESEEKEFCPMAMDRFCNNPKFTTPLAVVLNFQLGLRVSELMALKFTDINGDYIDIERTEIADYSIDGTDGEVQVIKNGVKVVDYTKSKAGKRSLYLNKTAKDIIKLIRHTNMKYGYYHDDYIFVGLKGTRTTTMAVNECIYKICDDINIRRKSSHKIRKTYISSLFDGNININRIREIAGHEDEKTSLNNYCFDRVTNKEVEEKLERLNTVTNLRVNFN